RLASLEGGTGALCVASGHAAQMVVLSTLLQQPGDRYVAVRQLYGGSVNQFDHAFKRFGWECDWADALDLDSIRAAVRPETKAVFIESIANPGGLVTDIAAIAEIAHSVGAPLIVDNTLATPYLCRPFEHGADIVVHSLTKFLGGHGNSIGGAIIDGGRFDWAASGKFQHLVEPNVDYHGIEFVKTFGPIAFAIACRVLGLRALGPAMAPMNAFLILTGAETLPLRMEKHSANALAVARHLKAHPAVTWVSYGGLEGDPTYANARKYCPKGVGAVLTFGVRGGYEAGVKVVNSVQLLSHLANVGDTRSLIIHPASTTHRQLTDEQKVLAGAGPDVVRVSCGIEDVADIIADLDQALAAAG
ncbi:MAG: aminotransferase class V-fold PLP-dependent enzyme, partial [Caulobacterales bacterium]|nr:aminotransferase class V-fold PLP-dependent enzyme [Caulobacterales bacterium]